jgi:hypothetical protein
MAVDNHQAMSDLYRALLAQVVLDMRSDAERFDAAEWLFGTEDPVVNQWRDLVCLAADVNLDGLRASVRDANGDFERIGLISDLLRRAREYQ